MVTANKLLYTSSTPIENITCLITGEPIPEPVGDWDDMAVTAIALGLAPLLHRQLEQQQISVPPPTMAKLAVTRQAHANRNRGIAQQLGQILQACHRQEVPVIVLKGALLAPVAYPDPALRPMNDIDLLFQPADISRAGAILESLGYQGKHKDASHGPGVTKHLSTYRRAGNKGATPNPFLSAGADRMVEPHLSLEESWFGLAVDVTPGVWKRAVPVALDGQPAYRLSTDDTLLHLSVHATFHIIMGTPTFVQLYDICRVINVWPDEINWSQVACRAVQSGAAPFVYAALYWSQKLYKTPIPADTMRLPANATPPKLINYIHKLGAVELFNKTQQPPLVTLRQRLLRGLAARRETARWAGSMKARWRVWQTALAVHKTDTATLLMGKKLKTES